MDVRTIWGVRTNSAPEWITAPRISYADHKSESMSPNRWNHTFSVRALTLPFTFRIPILAVSQSVWAEQVAPDCQVATFSQILKMENILFLVPSGRR